MTIPAFLGDKVSRTHENELLQDLLEPLEGLWSTSTDWIYAVAHAMWEGVFVLPNLIASIGLDVSDVVAVVVQSFDKKKNQYARRAVALSQEAGNV